MRCRYCHSEMTIPEWWPKEATETGLEFYVCTCGASVTVDWDKPPERDDCGDPERMREIRPMCGNCGAFLMPGDQTCWHCGVHFIEETSPTIQ